MKRGFTLIEVLIAAAVVLCLVGMIAGAICKFTAKPTVVSTQPIGSAEASSARNVIRVPYGQIEGYLGTLPGNVRMVTVVPVFTGSGKTFDISHYLVVVERAEK